MKWDNWEHGENFSREFRLKMLIEDIEFRNSRPQRKPIARNTYDIEKETDKAVRMNYWNMINSQIQDSLINI